MVTALEAPPESLDEAEQKFVASIREHGWFRTSVFGDGDGPGFSYTTGFWSSARQPELIMFGMKSEIAHDVFWDLFHDAKAGRAVPTGVRASGVFANLPAYAFQVAVRHYSDNLGWSRWFYGGDDFPCLQIVWPDRAGRFPWENGFDRAFARDQADLSDRGWAQSLAH